MNGGNQLSLDSTLAASARTPPRVIATNRPARACPARRLCEAPASRRSYRCRVESNSLNPCASTAVSKIRSGVGRQSNQSRRARLCGRYALQPCECPYSANFLLLLHQLAFSAIWTKPAVGRLGTIFRVGHVHTGAGAHRHHIVAVYVDTRDDAGLREVVPLEVWL